MSTSTTKAKDKSTPTRLIKYMGASHVRRLEKGEDFGGELASGLARTLVWDIDAHHVLDVEDLPEVQVELLLEQPLNADGTGHEFIDVTGQERLPVSVGQQLWRGQRPHAKVRLGDRLPKQDTDLQAARANQTGSTAAPSGASTEGGVTGTPDPATSTGATG